jgi:hypothetical protein
MLQHVTYYFSKQVEAVSGPVAYMTRSRKRAPSSQSSGGKSPSGSNGSSTAMSGNKLFL